MADKSAEGPRPFALAVAADPGHRQLGVVIEDRQRDAAEEGERADMAVEKGFRRLRRIGLHEGRIRMRQIHEEHVHLLPDAADHADRLAEIHLRVAGRMRQRHKGLPGPRSREPHILLHRRVAAVEAVLGAEPIVNPLGGMPLLRRRRHIGRQNRIDDGNERP